MFGINIQMALRKLRRGRRAPLRRAKRPARMARSRPAQPVQMFKRTVYTQNEITVPASLGAFTSVARTFSLGNLPGASDFTSLYDQYQIKAVKITLLPKWTQNNQNTAAGSAPIGRVASVLDYDDNAFPASMGEMSQYQNFKLTNGVRTHSRYLKPRCLLQGVNAGGTTMNLPTRTQWIDCNQSAVPWFGVKFGFIGTTIEQQYDAKIDYYLAFKNVR